MTKYANQYIFLTRLVYDLSLNMSKLFVYVLHNLLSDYKNSTVACIILQYRFSEGAIVC